MPIAAIPVCFSPQ